MVSADGVEPSISTTRQVTSSVPPTNTSGCAGVVGLSGCGNEVGVAGALVGRGDGEASRADVTVVGVGVAGTGVAAALVGRGVAGTGSLAACVEVGCATSDGNTDCSVPPQATTSAATTTMHRVAAPTRNPIAPILPSPFDESICG